MVWFTFSTIDQSDVCLQFVYIAKEKLLSVKVFTESNNMCFSYTAHLGKDDTPKNVEV